MLLEYSYRSTGQGVPRGSGDAGVTTSNPNVITGDTSFKQERSKSAAEKKVFDDEQRAYDNAFVMPYTLDRINDVMLNILNGVGEATDMINKTISHPSLKDPQIEVLEQRVEILDKIKKSIIHMVHELDDMTITTK